MRYCSFLPFAACFGYAANAEVAAAYSAYDDDAVVPFYSPFNFMFLSNSESLPTCKVSSIVAEKIKKMADTSSTHDARPPTLKILCFGDSLTAGYSRYGTLHFPYAVHLKEPLKAAFPSTKVHIDVHGMSGALVQSQYTGRLSRSCEKVRGEPYDWIIVLGGTNDLGWGLQPEEIYEGLQKVWDIGLRSGANVLALNVIEAAFTDGTIIQRRDALNALIANHKQDRWYTMDLKSAVPYFALEESKRDDVWDDGLHLTEEGYKMMGEAIATHMVRLLGSLDSWKNINHSQT